MELLHTGDPKSAQLEAFCDRLAALAPRLEVRRKKMDTDDPPAIGVLPNLRYHGVPEANELTPFLEMVSMAAGNVAGDTPSPPSGLAEMELPARLLLYVAPGCTHCPAMVRRMAPLTVGTEKVRLAIMDASLFQETAEADRIRSVPTLILDGNYRFNGVVPLEDVMQMLISRDPADLSPSALLGLIEEGNAGKVAELMVTHRMVFPALIDLLTDEKWPRRLGAMVALESAAEIDLALAQTAAPLLVDRLDTVSDAVRGDIVYLLGEIGSPEIAPILEAIVNSASSAELAETAAEALERIRTR